MNRDDIIRMARKAGLVLGYPFLPEHLERFAALVAAAEREVVEQQMLKMGELYGRACRENGEASGAAAEREACARVCEARYMGDNNREDMEAKRCAAAIRARGDDEPR